MKPVRFIIMIVAILAAEVNAQYTQAFYFLLDPASVSTFGSGWQGTATLTPDDAFTYNPAKLTLTGDTRLSYFRTPYYMIGRQIPFTNIELYKTLKGGGTFGIRYRNWDWGEYVVTTPESPDPAGSSKSYDRGFTIGYAREINENLSAGAQLTYAYSYLGEVRSKGLLLSLGVLYNPDILEKRFTFGASIMNLGTAVEYSGENGNFYDPPPTNLNLAANFITTENEYFRIPFDLTITKPFSKRDDDGNGESSFKSLFSEWKNFPNDLLVSTGLSFLWKPLNLGKGFGYVQELFIGDLSWGIKHNLRNFYTHGMNIGIDYKGVQFKMGYAGVFHNVHYPSFMEWVYPYENFQFTLSLNNNLFEKRTNPEINNLPVLDKIIISAGAGAVLRTGKAKSYTIQSLFPYDFSFPNTGIFNAEAAFYFDKNNALVTSLYYNSVPIKVNVLSYTMVDSKYETFSFFSSYRYHISRIDENFFVQGGLGVYRENLVAENSYPKYNYKSILQAAAGYQYNLLTFLVITPQVEYNNIIVRGGSDAPRMEGRSQFNLMVKIGYVIL